MKILYRATAHVEQGRNGRARSDDGALEVDLSVPESLGGAGGTGTNPEQLFAAGYGACFLGAVMVAAQRKRVELTEQDLTAEVSVGIGPQKGGAYNLEVELKVGLAGVEPELAREIVELAHETCPYSNATRGNVDVTLGLIDA